MAKQPPRYPGPEPQQVPKRLNVFAPVKLNPETVERERSAAVLRMGKKLLPDTDLAPLRRFSREILLVRPDDSETDKKLKRLTLTLALIFNDLKDLHWFGVQLRYGQPPPSDAKKPDPYVGQWNAMGGLVHRLLSAFLVEMMKVLEANSALFETERFKRAVSAIEGKSAKDGWGILVESLRLEEGGRSAHPLARFLRKVRNQAASHYGHKEELKPLSEGYRRVFETGSSEQSAFAFASLGDNMEETRFFLADAAVSELVRGFREGEGVTDDEFGGFIRVVNYALRFVVASLLEQFEGEAGASSRVDTPSSAL